MATATNYEVPPEVRTLVERARELLVAEWRWHSHRRTGESPALVAVVTTVEGNAEELGLEEVDGHDGLFAGLVERSALQPLFDRGRERCKTIRDRVIAARLLTYVDEPVAALGCVRLLVIPGNTSVHVNTLRVVTRLEML